MTTSQVQSVFLECIIILKLTMQDYFTIGLSTKIMILDILY